MATIAELIKHRTTEQARTYEPTIIEQERKATKAERAREQEMLRTQARIEKQRQELFVQRNELIDERNSITCALVQFQVVRKSDGKNVAKPNRKATCDMLRARLAGVNTRLDNVNKRLGIGQPSQHPAAVRRRDHNRRDALVLRMVSEKAKHENLVPGGELALMSIEARELSITLRPEGGYKQAPALRGLEYPRTDENSKRGIKAERERLCTCLETVIDVHGESERTERMMAHIERLDSYIDFMAELEGPIRENRMVLRVPGRYKEYNLRRCA